MKILRIIGSMHPRSGGPCQGIRNIVPALGELGVVNEVVCLDDPASDFLGHDPFPVYALGASIPPWGYHKTLLPWLKEHISEYDLVILHGLWQYNGYALLKTLRGLKKESGLPPKVYLMPHGMLDPYFQKSPGRRVQAIRNWIYWKLIESRLVRETDGILFTTQEELNLANDSFRPYHPKAVFNAGYGIQPAPVMEREEILSTNKKNGLPAEPYLLFLSRIHEKKGVDLLITAYKQLKQQDCKLSRLVIAGPGLESDYGKQMITLAANDPDILFPGMLSSFSKWAAFHGSEAFILPSHQENFGIAVVEAMACGKPVLISNKINIWREISEHAAGLIEDDTVEGTITLLKHWSGMKPEAKVTMGKAAMESFTSLFSVKQVARQVKELFDRQQNA
ncbi:MAG: glycosyltransferase [Chitinophagaceae bacterium]